MCAAIPEVPFLLFRAWLQVMQSMKLLYYNILHKNDIASQLKLFEVQPSFDLYNVNADYDVIDTHIWNTFCVVPYSCAGHLVPYVAAVKNPYPVTSLYGTMYVRHIHQDVYVYL